MKGGDVSYVQKENEQKAFEAKFSERRENASKKQDEYCFARRISDVVVNPNRCLFHWSELRLRPFLFKGAVCRVIIL